MPRALTIAGSDSGGGAGIQADLKTFAALGVYGMSAITSLTAQNTVAVQGIQLATADFVSLQIDSVATDIGIDAAKTGMLANEAIIHAVADACRRHAIEKLVVDPVMVSKSGHALLDPAAVDALRRELAPRALLITPNVPEAAALAGVDLTTEAQIPEVAKRILDLGPRYVLFKGGHFEGGTCTDRLYGGGETITVARPRIATRNTHGTGCTYSAAITAFLARGWDLPGAIVSARDYLQGAIEHSLSLGCGHGPLHHGWQATASDRVQ